MTFLTGLLGWPLGHSVSPAMHAAAFRALGLDGRYEALPTAPEQLAAVVAGLAASGFRGVNVTIPHKQAVMPLLDELSDAARAIGAVNTIVVEDKLVSIREDPTRPTTRRGDNTDWLGFLHPLDERGFDLAGKHALLLGAGGSARAVGYALARRGVASLAVWNHNLQRATDLAQHLRHHFRDLTIATSANLDQLSKRQEFSSRFGRSPTEPNRQVISCQLLTTPPIPQSTNLPIYQSTDLIINTTPLGMWPNADASPWPVDLPFPPGALVYDLVYRPEETLFLRQASAAGCATQGGLEMLVAQGAASFELWTGQQPPLAVMMAAARDGLTQTKRS